MTALPLSDSADPRVPVVLDMLKKSLHMGGNFTLDSRRILAALDAWDAEGRPTRHVKDFPTAEPPDTDVLRIVNAWCIESNNIGGIDAGDLAWRLEQAGYDLTKIPDTTGETP